MEERVNIAELLRDCPKGMELDCVMYDNVKFDYVLEGHSSPIKVDSPTGQISLDKYGCYSNNKQAKCVIFPKGKTTWEGFIPPREFKNGDIIFTRTFDATWVSIFKQISEDRCCTYIDLCIDDNKIFNTWGVCHIEEITEQRLATEKEKLKLFDAISAYNYESNEETKTLEKLPKFKVGDWVIHHSQERMIYQVEKSFLDVTYRIVPVNDKIGKAITTATEDAIHLWTIQDAKEGDVLIDRCDDYKNPLIFILKKFENVDFGRALKSDYSSYCFLTMSDIPRFKEGSFHHKHDIKPATKEQRDLLFQKMKDAGYEWDAEKKELKKIEQKPVEWGEEDENKIDFIKGLITMGRFADTNTIRTIWELLDSLCPSWKPSDKQMEQLGWIAEQNKNNMIGQELMTLYNDLKKLK